MKSLFFFLFFPVFFFSQNVNKEKDSIEAVRLKEYLEMQKEFLKDYAKRCREDSIRAVNNSKKQYSYFISRPAPSGPDKVEKKEVGILLEKKGIKWGGTWMGTDLIGYYTDNSCYYLVSSQISENKFGKDFFEEVQYKAAKLFIKNNPDFVFSHTRNKIDFRKKDTSMLLDFNDYDKAHQFIIDEFWRQSPLPNDYIKSKDEDLEMVTYDSILGKYEFKDVPGIDAYFVISKSGAIKNIEFDTIFLNKSNSKYKSYFESSLRKIIKKLKWRANTYKGIPINSSESIYIKLP
ncbi:hypothetical protein BAZ12_19600 [Elizabethkingia miricola]|uniref:Uncharacterized protein n=1 Tax=Elizabethkingia miricola TaxID=172045 RepID=A0ABD4DIU1_ELIMR|nr:MULTISPECIES: hypothetical protein [Elizabethkingia]KUY17051.1 hypothetical protein ATB95_11760 [Elizabethkingia miricola]MCL1654659.1 hypothetical protein [Elizabethkingia miricola]OPC72399.1 hypothetical protein BAZ13_06780 [Elizabethkingia miricola]OPC76217.1 hypothetical protein BAZ12_19600 [Elizabethkingia miricola]QCO47618.1 hypothetical protein FCS00_15025 [Elizabethkingia sp. 2-6]